MKTKIEKFREQSHFRYKIKWNSGLEEYVENNDVPLAFAMNCFDNLAIISAQHKIKNENHFLIMEGFLTELGYTFHHVDKESVDAETMLPDGKENIPAFLIEGISEETARSIANEFEQEAFLFFSMEPDLHIKLLGSCKKYKNLEALIFKYS